MFRQNSTNENRYVSFKFCARNYLAYDGLVNGKNAYLKTSTFNGKTYIWDCIFNTKIGSLTKHKIFFHLKKDKLRRINPIQLIIARTIHQSQGLSLDEMAFNPRNVNNHGLIYTTLFHLWTKENLYLFVPLQHKNFHFDDSLSQELSRLNSHAKYNLLVPQLKSW